MVNDHSNNETINPLLPNHGLLYLISSKGPFMYAIPQTVHIVAFVMPVVEHWLEEEIAQQGHHC